MSGTSVASRILVVDDDPLNILIIKDILEKIHILEYANSGEEALEKLKVFPADIILLDVMMDDMDGYEVVRQVRKLYSENYIKVILLSAKVNVNDRLEGYKSGADDYLTKPFEDEELLAKINVFIKLKYTQDQLRKSNDHLDNLNNNLEEQIEIRTNQLLEAEKLSSIGKYAAGIVHNLNNPLAAIMGYSQLLEDAQEIKGNPKLDERLKRIINSGNMMKKIISTILDKSKNDSNIVETEVDLNGVLNTLIELKNADTFFKNKVELSMELTDIPSVMGVYVHFSQSLGNIIDNCVDAMYGREIKKLRIASKCIENNIIIEIEDSGCGIPKENLERIYDPFFSTKTMNNEEYDRPTGTGLGMASCRQMLEAYNGNIGIQSEVDKGTMFTIILPVENES
ncbi:MAG: hypothetical protein COA79_08835 [Planctomycetota bacterium]|nr:MAG: hypothetical protein COA79_08835 [Planctomycetota bacterium]